MLDKLPYIHYLAKIHRARQTILISPAEIPAAEFNGGSFFAPVNDLGSFFPIYRFDFSIYRGQGKFLKPEQGKKVFNGMAFAAVDQRRDALICTFEYPFGLKPSNGHANMPLWFFEERPSHVTPRFRKVQSGGRGKLFHYRGDLRHSDFKHPFVELELGEPAILDDLLEEWGLSIVGCSPKLRYSQIRKQKAMPARG